jgi:hypothetical protein
MDNQVTSAREALMAELLQDVDVLLQRVERVHEELPGLIEQATKDAAGKAFLVARLNLETVIDQQAQKLTDAGRHAAALIGNQLTGSAAALVATREQLERRGRLFVIFAICLGLCAAGVGGYIGAKLAGT